MTAGECFSMKAFDKAYLTFIFDDGHIGFTKECFELFQSYGMPMGCAIVAAKVMENPEDIDLFLKIEKAGGEIFSHTYNHHALHKDNCTLEKIETELGDSYRALTKLGFKINGIIEAGNGGGENTANYELIETVSRKYYKYSNAYGVSPQYNKSRTWLPNHTLESGKKRISQAIENKEWLVISAHHFGEYSKENMTELLKFIDSKGKDKAEVVTWNYVYENFGNFTK